MPDGDADLVKQAGLSADQVNTIHIPVTDCTPPGPDDVTTFIDAVASAEGRGSVYVHCEAGVGRTGVMVACYRLQQGWDTADALQEARNFGCRCLTRSPSSSNTDPPAPWPPCRQHRMSSGKMSHSTPTRPASNAPFHHPRRDRGHDGHAARCRLTTPTHDSVQAPGADGDRERVAPRPNPREVRGEPLCFAVILAPHWSVQPEDTQVTSGVVAVLHRRRPRHPSWRCPRRSRRPVASPR